MIDAKGRGRPAARPDTTRAYWPEHVVDNWIHARIRGTDIEPAEMPDHPVLLPQKEVIKRTGLSRVSIWRMEQRGQFPPRIHIKPGGEA